MGHPYILTVVIFFFSNLCATSIEAKDCLKISYWDFQNKEVQVAKQLISEMYDKIGLCHQYVEIPTGRSVDKIRKSEVQAELWRTKNFTDKNREWVHYVPEPILNVSISLFYNRAHFENFDLKTSLKGGSIGTTIGAYQGEKFVAELGAKTVPVKDFKQLFLILKNNRVKSAIMPSVLFNSYSRQYGAISDIGEIVLYQTDVYHIVAQSHKHLIPALNKALIATKKKSDFFDRLKSIN